MAIFRSTSPTAQSSTSFASSGAQLASTTSTAPFAHATAANTGKRLKRVRKLTRLLDTAFRVPGTRFKFGLDSAIGLIPGVGDVATACVAGYLVYESYRIHQSKRLLARMAFNSTADMLVGSIPLVGDVVDFAFKSNQRNLELLEKHLEKRHRRTRA